MGSSEDTGLDERDLAGTWLAQLEAWRRDAVAAGIHEPEAMVLSTAGEDGRPSSRTVLLKGLDERGLVFYTNLDSRKGRQLAENPHVSLLFPWHPMGRQAIVLGQARQVGDAEADAYFSSRPYGSRIGAHASQQSRVIASRAALEAARAAMEARYPSDGPVPRPARWSGFRVVPESVEFWQRRPDRLHDRLRFRRLSETDWSLERLSP